MQTSLEGKTILITGASSGIGHAISESALQEGAHVIGASRNVGKMPEGIQGIHLDLEEESSIRDLFDQVPPIDAFINNAGLALLSSICDGSPSDWERMWRINVHGHALCAQLSLGKLNPKTGHIVNISSMSGHRVPPSGGFYSPTKFAVNAITQALRAELRSAGNPIRVSSVSPGFVDTPLLDHYFQGREEQLATTKQSIKMLTPQDIAQVVINILKTAPHVEIGDVSLKSSDQSI